MKSDIARLDPLICSGEEKLLSKLNPILREIYLI
jgi:hypothetical protein